MKTRFFTLLFITGILSSLYAQNPYSDALKLKKLGYTKVGSRIVFNKADSLKLVEILKFYEPDVTSYSELFVKFNTNPFVKIPIITNQSSSNQFVFEKSSLGAKSIFDQVGNLDVTMLADGLAKFLVKRTREEINVTFFEKFKEEMKKYPELRLLFPKTASFIDIIESYKYAAMIGALREAFEYDMINLPSNVTRLQNLTKVDCGSLIGDNLKNCESRIQTIMDLNKKEESIFFYSTAILVKNLQAGSNAATIVEEIGSNLHVEKFAKDSVVISNVANAAVFAKIISQGLRSKEGNNVWIDHNQLEILVKDTLAFKIYMGLIYQQVQRDKIIFEVNKKKVEVINIFKNNTETINSFSKYLSEVVLSGEILNNDYNEIKRKKDAKEIFTYEDYNRYMNDLISFMEDVSSTPPSFEFPQQSKINDYLIVARSATGLYYDVKSADYNSALLNAVIILDKTLGSTYQFRNQLIQFGTFIASVAEAENSDDVAAAIEAAALPSGSSRIKRETPINISLNAFVGLYGGKEWLPALQDKNERGKFSAGLLAPVGVAVNFGRLMKSSQDKGGKSISVFASLIDVGALASFRFDDDSTQTLPEVKLKNIISPGIFLIFGFGKSPVSLAIGGQMGPQLRTINAQNVDVSKDIYYKFSGSILIDIPLLNLYTKPKTIE